MKKDKPLEKLREYKMPIGVGISLIIIAGILLQNERILTAGVIGLMLFVFGAVIYEVISKKRILKQKCTLSIMGKCMAIQRDNSKDGASYAPIYQIEYKGETLTLPSTVYSTYCDIKVDQVRELKIDPEKPQNFIEVKRRTVSLPAKIFVITFIIIWVLAWVNTIVR